MGVDPLWVVRLNAPFTLFTLPSRQTLRVCSAGGSPGLAGKACPALLPARTRDAAQPKQRIG